MEQEQALMSFVFTSTKDIQLLGLRVEYIQCLVGGVLLAVLSNVNVKQVTNQDVK